jgi:nucleotide-binding universal stress UspA family protein
MYDRILLPTDGSDAARAAAEAAVAVAERFGAELAVVHVATPGERDDGTTPGRRALDDVERRATAAGVEATTAVVEGRGRVSGTLLDYADECGADCIVMGTRGRTGLDRMLLGSVAERTLRNAAVPVFTVHEDTVVDPAFDDVLVPTDGSEAAGVALDHAIDLVRATGGTLHVAHVVDLGVVWGDVEAGTVLDAMEQTGERAVQRAVARAEAADVPTVEASVLQGAPYRAILDHAEDRDVDCIVMGSHGRTGLDRVLLGSVAERVVRLSTTPVLALGATGD